MTTEQIIKWLENEKWYPIVHPTDVELETSKLLNAILDDIIIRFKKDNAD